MGINFFELGMLGGGYSAPLMPGPLDGMAMRATGTLVFGLFFVLAITQSRADDAPPESLEDAFRKATFSLLYRRSELPQPLVTYFLSRAPQSAPLADLLAEPGRAFNPYCVVEHGIPPARLVFAGTSGSVSFALFEKGGRSHHLVVVLLGAGDFADKHCEYSLPLESLGLASLKERIRGASPECT